MLEAVGGAALVRDAYRHAARDGYLWHEFGDSHLILPGDGG
jgi:S-adenosylmethionine:tRNA ribosyltransferase-isomerase